MHRRHDRHRPHLAAVHVREPCSDATGLERVRSIDWANLNLRVNGLSPKSMRHTSERAHDRERRLRVLRRHGLVEKQHLHGQAQMN